MALRRSRSTWPTWLGFCGTFTVRWWAIVHESLASHASSDFWRKTQGLERQQMGTDSDVFFLSVWAMCLMLMELRSWHLMTVGVWNISCHSSREKPMWDFDPVQKFESDMDCTKTYVYYLFLSYVLEIFEHIQRSCSLQRLFCSTMPWQCPLNTAWLVVFNSQQPTANRCLGHASTRIQDHHDANQRVATNKESLDLRSAVLILIYFDCPFVSF